MLPGAENGLSDHEAGIRFNDFSERPERSEFEGARMTDRSRETSCQVSALTETGLLNVTAVMICRRHLDLLFSGTKRRNIR